MVASRSRWRCSTPQILDPATSRPKSEKQAPRRRPVKKTTQNTIRTTKPTWKANRTYYPQPPTSTNTSTSTNTKKSSITNVNAAIKNNTTSNTNNTTDPNSPGLVPWACQILYRLVLRVLVSNWSWFMSGPRALPAKQASPVSRQSPSGHSRTEGVALFDRIEQFGPDMCFCPTPMLSSASPKTTFTAQQHSTRNTNCCLCWYTYDAIMCFRKSAWRDCRYEQKPAFGVEGVACL